MPPHIPGLPPQRGPQQESLLGSGLLLSPGYEAALLGSSEHPLLGNTGLITLFLQDVPYRVNFVTSSVPCHLCSVNQSLHSCF